MSVFVRGGVLLCEEGEQPKSHPRDERHHHILLTAHPAPSAKAFSDHTAGCGNGRVEERPLVAAAHLSPFSWSPSQLQGTSFPDVGRKYRRGCKQVEGLKKGSRGLEWEQGPRQGHNRDLPISISLSLGEGKSSMTWHRGLWCTAFEHRGKILLQDIPQGAVVWAGLSKLKGKQPGPCCRGVGGEQVN